LRARRPCRTNGARGAINLADPTPFGVNDEVACDGDRARRDITDRVVREQRIGHRTEGEARQLDVIVDPEPQPELRRRDQVFGDEGLDVAEIDREVAVAQLNCGGGFAHLNPERVDVGLPRIEREGQGHRTHNRLAVEVREDTLKRNDVRNLSLRA